MIRDTAGESQNWSLSLTKTNTDRYEFCNSNGWKDHEEDAEILFDGNLREMLQILEDNSDRK